MADVLSRSKWLVLLAVTAVLGVGLMPASATVIDRGHYTIDDDLQPDTGCGFTLNSHVIGSGSFVVRSIDGEAFLLTDSHRVVETVTSPDGEGFFTISHSGVFKEIRGTHLEGTLYEFTSVEAGQPFTLRDSDGNIVLRDRGSIFYTETFDTLGDGTPGAVPVPGTFSAVLHGPHPAFDADVCAVAADLLGVD